MTDKIVVLVTTSSLRESKKIAKHLVEARLAACVNITQPIQSIYRWQGKVEGNQGEGHGPAPTVTLDDQPTVNDSRQIPSPRPTRRPR